MRLRELKVYYLIIMTSLSSLTMLAQEFEFSKYLLDSTTRRPLVRAKVKSLIELSTLPNGKICARGFYFDKMGRMIACYFPDYGPRLLTKVTYIYNSDGKLERQNHFSDKDTSKLVEWKNFEYDSEGYLVKETITNIDAQGKYHSKVTLNEKPIKSAHKTVRNQIITDMGLTSETVMYVDSTDNEYKFRVVIRSNGAVGASKQSLRIYNKYIERSFSKDNIEYEDRITFHYKSSDPELAIVRRTRILYDDKKREIEKKESSYEDALNYYGYPNEILQYPRDENKIFQLIDKGKVEGKVVETIKYFYDQDGLLLETNFKDRIKQTNSKFKYNAKGELIEIEKTFKKRIVYTYNDRGFVSSVSTFDVKVGTVEEVLLDQTNYNFEYYD